MEVKVIKFTSWLMAVFTLIITLYTLIIGVRLAFCSWNIIDARENFSIEFSNEVYHSTNEYRKEIASENEFANMVCHMSNDMRLKLLFLEGAVLAISYVLFGFMCACERRIAMRKRRMAARRQQKSRG